MKNQNIPKTLFKYRSAGKNESRIFDILEGKLYFSTIEKFNDGFEYFYTYSKERYINDDHNQLVRLSPEENVKRFDPIVNSLKKDAGYYCLSENHSDLAMWALYANGHNGVCIGFDWEQLKSAGPWQFPEKIEYLESPIDIDQHPPGIGWHKVFTSKHTSFSFEAEWRLRLDQPGNTPKEKQAFIKNSISQIIFGFRTTPEFQVHFF